MTEQEYTEFTLGKEFWLTFDKIMDRGIATHVYTDGALLTVAEYKELIELEGVIESATEAEEAGEAVAEESEVVEVVEVVEAPKPEAPKAKGNGLLVKR